MQKIKRMSTAGTVICIISVILYIAIILFISFGGIDLFMGFAGENMDKMGQVDSNSPSAGYEVLGYLAGGALGFLGGLFLFMFAIFLGFLALYQIPAIITGLYASSRGKKGYDAQACLKVYKIDGFVKAIMNGIVLLIVLIGIMGELGNSSISDIFTAIVLIWNYIVVFILSVLQIKNIKIEESSY